MEKLSREQMLDLSAQAEAELAHISASPQSQLLKKPLALLQRLDDSCRAVLPQKDYETNYQYQLQTLQLALRHAMQENSSKNLKEITELAVGIAGRLHESMKTDASLRRVAREKKEIVFLPYKSSMWDSLESIWQAAAADKEHCNCYVVPIPYADRNPDGTIHEWHNERDLYPDYVPTYDCDTFDLETLHPDVIFVHNIYDNCNIVTTVDSRFYTDKLKK